MLEFILSLPTLAAAFSTDTICIVHRVYRRPLNTLFDREGDDMRFPNALITPNDALLPPCMAERVQDILPSGIYIGSPPLPDS